MRDDPIIAIRRLLIRDKGVPEAKVRPEARLVHDLGVDGDDGAEMLAKLHHEFGTDFAELDRQWRTFFNCESASLRRTSGRVGRRVSLARGRRYFGYAGPLRRRKLAGGARVRQNLAPVTIGGLAEIVQSGRWPTDPTSVR